jgi:cell division protein FtsB
MPSQSVRSSRRSPEPKLRLPKGLREGRLGRIALLAGVVLILGFYLTSGVKLVVGHYERVATAEDVHQLQKEQDRLTARRRALTGQQGVATEARRLGMVMPGEVPYVVTGLPGDRH